MAIQELTAPEINLVSGGLVLSGLVVDLQLTVNTPGSGLSILGDLLNGLLTAVANLLNGLLGGGA